MSNDNLKTWPERIYLQHFEDDEIQDYHGCEDISWCVDKIFESDVEYVRADLVKKAAPATDDSRAGTFNEFGTGY